MLNNTVIPFKDIDIIPSRKEFIDINDRKIIDDDINKKNNLLFLPTYLKEIHIQDEKYQKSNYKILLMGIFKDGRRVNVLLDGIEPYFEVMIPDTDSDGNIKIGIGRSADIYTRQEYIDKIRQILSESNNTKPLKTSIINAKPFKGFQENNNSFIRFYYNKTKSRTAAIKLLLNHEYLTTHDDLNNYYRVVCRDYLTTFSYWSILSNYSIEYLNYIKGDTFKIHIKDFKPLPEEDLTIDLLKDKTLSCCWDIETYSMDGDIPKPENKNDSMRCIGLTFQFVNDDTPIIKIALCDMPSNPEPECVTVICGNEQNLIKAFGIIIEKMRPEFITGFNDSEYDWNWLVKRASQTKGLLSNLAKKMDCINPWYSYSDDEVFKWNYRKESVKITADTNADGATLSMAGYLAIDTRTIYRKLYPTSEKSSLKWFLEMNKLGGKEDMPYTRLFRIYKELLELSNNENVIWDNSGNSLDFEFKDSTSPKLLDKYKDLKSEHAEINKYCVVDALRCHELLKIRSVIMDHREVSNQSYCSVDDSFYRANGMKVRNLTIAEGQKKSFNIRFSNITGTRESDAKYPGAYVVPPKKGLKISKLTIEERINKANITKNSKNKDYQDWLNIDEKEITKYKEIIEEFGPVIPKEEIKNIEDKYGTLGEPFKNFLLESIGRPITGLDFSSLYPSLMMAYNFSPEKCIFDKHIAKEFYNRTNNKLTKVDFMFGTRRIVAWFVWHNNQLNPYIDETTTDNKILNENFNFGIYPYILNGLFNKRKLIKKKMSVFLHKKEEMEAIENKEQGYLSKNLDEYTDCCFNINYLNSKQLALKVFMNTFYGEAGNQISPFFLVEVAGGITSYGQKNIKAAQSFVQREGCIVNYGDTDSIYLSIPEKFFSNYDKDYYLGKISKLEYWTKLVEETFIQIKPINNKVNDMFLENNGTTFLKMAYEEVLYPVIFTAKKKYYGIPHENIANFKPRDLFVRGLEVKKRGVSGLLRDIFNELMWTSVNPDNLFTLLELVQMKIDEIYGRKWDFNDFIQTAIYRPKKKNISIHTFVKRMNERNISVPVNERFEYVVIKRYPFKYDYRGRKTDLSVGDKMEFPHIAKVNNMEIDLDHYMTGSVNGQLARLITYCETFNIDPLNDSPEELKIADEKTYKNACDFIDNYCKQYYSIYNTFGGRNKKIYKIVSNKISKFMDTNNVSSYELLTGNVKMSIEDVVDNIKGREKFAEWFLETVEKKAIKLSKGYGESYIKEEFKKFKDIECKEERYEKKKQRINLLQKIYYGIPKKSILYIRDKSFQQTISILSRRLRENADNYMKIYNRYEQQVQSLSHIIKDNMNISDELYEPTNNSIDIKMDDYLDSIPIDIEGIIENEAKLYIKQMDDDKNFQTLLCNFRVMYADCLSAFLFIKKTISIVDTLKSIRDSNNNVIVRPDSIIENQIIEDIKENTKLIINLDI